MAIADPNDILLFKDPVAQNPDWHLWWADKGMVRWENQRTGKHGSLTARNALERLQAINDMIANSRGSGKSYMRGDEIGKYQGYVDKMLIIIKKAQQQGMPDNPNHVKQLVGELRAKRRSRLVVMPGNYDF